MSNRGKLKVYVGFAPGAGKTWRALDEAHALRARAIDVVVGVVEPHGRADLLARTTGLEMVPRRRIEYRGVTIEEMDLAAVSRRRPQVAIVDELCHTNAPGSVNKKRYQDVQQLLDAGIDVVTTIDIQRLESLVDRVSRITGEAVRETVPDSVLKHADQLLMVDVDLDELAHRLRSGAILPPEQVPLALEHQFRPTCLAMLRELALREVADSVERVSAKRADHDGQLRSSSRVMVCLSSHPPQSAALLDRGSRIAGRLATHWFVVYVETPSEDPHSIDGALRRLLDDNIEKARELGAEVVRLRGSDPVATLLDFARAHGVGQIVIGRSHQPWWRQVLGRSVALRLVREADGFDIHIVGHGDGPEREPA